MSPPRPQKGSALPRLSISRERPGGSRGVRRAMRPHCPGRCTRAPGQRSDRPFSVTSPPPSKTEVVMDRFRHPFRGATHVPTSAPEGQRSAATFIFEGASGGVERREKGRRPPSPQDGAGLPQERGATGPSLSPTPLENRSRGGVLPSPAPVRGTCPHLGPRRAALRRHFHFRGNDRVSRET